MDWQPSALLGVALLILLAREREAARGRGELKRLAQTLATRPLPEIAKFRAGVREQTLHPLVATVDGRVLIPDAGGSGSQDTRRAMGDAAGSGGNFVVHPVTHPATGRARQQTCFVQPIIGTDQYVSIGMFL